MRDLFDMEKETFLFQEIDNQWIGLENVLAFHSGTSSVEAASIIYGRKNRKRRILFLPQLKVFHAMSCAIWTSPVSGFHVYKICGQERDSAADNPRMARSGKLADFLKRHFIQTPTLF